MKLPWSKEDEIKELEQQVEQLQNKVEDLKEEKQTFKERFEAEKDRRSKLSAEKQEAEEKINKLEQKIQNTGNNTEEEIKREETETNTQKISFKEAKRILHKLNSINSTEKELTTAHIPETVKDIPDQQGLKGSISGQNYNFISDDTSFIAFLDEDFLHIKLKTRPFFEPGWKLSDNFQTQQLTSFIQKEKKWAAVSAGETTIFEEKDGEIQEKEKIESRVDSKQKKGGFSQGRFERKRQEQIDEHLRMIKDKIDEDTLLVGEESLCKKLPGQFLGGFDGDRGSVNSLYNFRLVLK